AAKAAGDTGAPGTALVLGTDPAKHNIAAANAKLAQARGDLANAKKLAEGLGGIAKTEQAVQGNTNLGELHKAADAFAKERAAAHKPPHAKLAKAEPDAAKTALDEAKKHIGAKDAAAAGKALAIVGEKLTAARKTEVEHARYIERHATLAKRLEHLK